MIINKELDSLVKYECVCFDSEKSFLIRFTSSDAWKLTGVYFSSKTVYFNYVLYSGRQKADSCKREDFIKWYNTNKIHQIGDFSI